MNYRKLHSFEVSPKEAIEIQKNLQSRIILRGSTHKIKKIAGADVSFPLTEEKAIAAVVVLSFPDLKIIERVRKEEKAKFPYIPGLLTFREGPIFLSAFAALRENPDLIIFDGQGIAHPRRLGIATHMGILLNKPTIGCAKTYLYGTYNLPKNEKGRYSYLKGKKGEGIIGAVVRTRKDVRPVFVSPGHKMDIKTAVKIVLMCSSKFRIPEPIRMAHFWAKCTLSE